MTIIRYRTAGSGASKPAGAAERLEALEAAEAARGLLASYAASVDAQDAGRLESLLAGDVALVIGDTTVSGREAVAGFFANAFRDDPAPKSHFITNVATRWLGGGRVGADAYFLWTAREEQQSILGWGTYAFEVRTSGATALITRLEIGIRHAGDIGDGWASGPSAD